MNERWSDLWVRLASALVLAGLAVAAAWGGHLSFVALTAILVGIAMWELSCMHAPLERQVSYALAGVAAVISVPIWALLDKDAAFPALIYGIEGAGFRAGCPAVSQARQVGRGGVCSGDCWDRSGDLVALCPAGLVDPAAGHGHRDGSGRLLLRALLRRAKILAQHLAQKDMVRHLGRLGRGGPFCRRDGPIGRSRRIRHCAWRCSCRSVRKWEISRKAP